MTEFIIGLLHAILTVFFASVIYYMLVMVYEITIMLYRNHKSDQS